MPKQKIHSVISLNLLKPQSNPEKLLAKIVKWLLASGRYLFVFVEAIVLIAFAARFKLDADLASRKEAIEEKIPYIESLKSYEIIIRQTQLKLDNISTIKHSNADLPGVLKKIADQTPLGVRISGINIKKSINGAEVTITGETQSNGDLTGFLAGLGGDGAFTNVNLGNAGLEEGIIQFTISASARMDQGEIYEK